MFERVMNEEKSSSTSSVKTMAGMTVLSGVLSTLVSIH